MATSTVTKSVATSTQRVLIAQYKNLWVAVPMDMVRKIMRIADLMLETEVLPPIVEIDDLSAQVVHLYEHIYGIANPEGNSHLVAIQLENGQGFALPMTRLPIILNLETEAIKPIPIEYRDLYTLEIASHITQLKQGKTNITIFILAMEKLEELVADMLAADRVI
jgi:hypothetical protein